MVGGESPMQRGLSIVLTAAQVSPEIPVVREYIQERISSSYPIHISHYIFQARPFFRACYTYTLPASPIIEHMVQLLRASVLESSVPSSVPNILYHS
jgi:hypothetical protein